MTIKIKGKGKIFVTSQGEVLQRSGNRFKIEYEIGKGTTFTWFPVSMITSVTQGKEIKRQGKAKRNITKEPL